MNTNSSQFDNVLDFNAAKVVKNRTGRAAAIKHSTTPESPDLVKHENEAMALGNPPAKKESVLMRAGKYLGLVE